MSEIADKPAVIRADQWDTVADDVKAGRCVVTSYYGVEILAMSHQSDYGDLYACIGRYKDETFPTVYDGLDKFSVTWVTGDSCQVI